MIKRYKSFIESNNSEYYKEISHEDYLKYISLSYKERTNFTKEEIDIIKSSLEKINIRIEIVNSRNGKIILYIYRRLEHLLSISILKLTDEWYISAIITEIEEKSYKCDQLSGLVKFLNNTMDKYCSKKIRISESHEYENKIISENEWHNYMRNWKHVKLTNKEYITLENFTKEYNFIIRENDFNNIGNVYSRYYHITGGNGITIYIDPIEDELFLLSLTPKKYIKCDSFKGLLMVLKNFLEECAKNNDITIKNKLTESHHYRNEEINHNAYIGLIKSDCIYKIDEHIFLKLENFVKKFDGSIETKSEKWYGMIDKYDAFLIKFPRSYLSVKVTPLNDEYFLIDDTERYYKCDQVEGLIEKLQEIIKNKNEVRKMKEYAYRSNMRFESISGTEWVGHVGPNYGEPNLPVTVSKSETTVLFSDFTNQFYTAQDFDNLYTDYLKSGGKKVKNIFNYENLDKVLRFLKEN